MSRVASVRRPSISIAYLQLLVEILIERRISADRLFERQPITPEMLEQPQARMSETQWTLLILRALELTSDPGLGYEYGLRMRPSLHGMLGYAALSSASLRDAQDLTQRYFQSRQARFDLSLVETARQARMDLVERVPIPVARSFFIANILLGLARSTAALMGRELAKLPGLEVWFDSAAPDHYAAWRDRLPTLRFGRPHNAVVVPLDWLSLRPVLADPLASRQAVAICERELALAAGQESDITARVRAELRSGEGMGFPALDTIAARLHLSGRSLKRKLQQQGASFLSLLEDARRREAQQLLEHSELRIDDIAERLGYRNPANFSRAFQRRIGEPPSAWRQRQAAINRE